MKAPRTPKRGEIWLERRRPLIQPSRHVKIDRDPAGGFVCIITVILAHDPPRWVRKPGTRLNTTTIERFQKAFEFYGRGTQ